MLSPNPPRLRPRFDHNCKPVFSDWNKTCNSAIVKLAEMRSAMHADIGRAPLVIAHLRRRRARAQMFTASGRGLMVAVIAAAAAMIGLGAVTGRAHSSPQPAAYGFIGR